LKWQSALSAFERKQLEKLMDTPPNAADEQLKLWNGPAGRAWVEVQEPLDNLFRPFENLLVEAAAAHWARLGARPSDASESRLRLLDVGCGTGSTTLAMARRLGAASSCVGVDISEPMLEVARTRAEREGSSATFISADAQTYAFEPASFDRVVSRFGVMFFDDPVRAFANLLQAARRGAELLCIAWRSAAENPFMTTAERAAAPLLPNIPPRRPNAPGQFAFADRSRVQHILEESGWTDVDIQPIDVPCVLPEHELTRYITRLGPVGSMLQSADEATRSRVIKTVRAAFDPFVHGSETRLTAACWTVSARAPSSR
jgi:ubiquinone/menaquinone biosynthesis C-methylase UbiE